MTGRVRVPATEKDCPVILSWLISTGVEFPFERETVALAVLPIDTAPKVTVLGETTRVPVFPAITREAPQPDRTRRRQQDNMIYRAVHQRLSQQI